MRAVFFGTPAVAVPALQALDEVAEVVGVVCQPDRPAGRGMRVSVPAVKQAAVDLGLPVFQPKAVKTGALAAWLEDLRPDVSLVMAYGRILPIQVLEAPRCGSLNLHASLLPKYRGAAPIQWAIVRGETETGISLMRMDEGMDTGPVYSWHRIPIAPTETAGQLTERLAQVAAEVTRVDVPRVVRGQLEASPQDHTAASYAPPIDSELCAIDWTETARDIVNRIRGLSPRPAAYTSVRGKRLKLLEARESGAIDLAAGRVELTPGCIRVGTGQGAVQVLTAQLEGKRAASAPDLINGRILRAGELLGGSSE